jgi:XTP/dITP diphosphohydrolase
MENELGDLIFSIVNVARLYEIDPESALERTNQKFTRRFNYLEEQTLLKGRSLHTMSLEEMDVYWNEAKKKENK